MNKGLFVILNGTLITTKSGKSFPLHSEDWKFTTKWDKMIENARFANFTIIIIDNQLSVGEGLVGEDQFVAKDLKICRIIEKDLHLPKNTLITTYCYNEDNPFMVKPNPGMLYEMGLEYDIVLSDSMLIGNSEQDERFAKLAGIGTYYTLDDVKQNYT